VSIKCSEEARAMITWALMASAVVALVLVVLVQDKWTSEDSWFVAVFASAIMAMTISIRSIRDDDAEEKLEPSPSVGLPG
jgi:hypothetical protein